jgi:hypothetical protein
MAMDTGKVIITRHARQRMRERKINALMVYECLRLGVLVHEPEPSLRHGSLECRMERYIAGRNCCVVAGLCDEMPEMICVTVFFSD